MQSVFNELSIPQCADKETANVAILDFIRSFIALTKKGIKGFRFYNYLHEIELAPDYTFQQWVDQSTQHTLKSIFVGEIRHPFISPDTSEETTFLSHQYFFNDSVHENVECIGLGTAHIYEAIAVSFGTSSSWRKHLLPIIEKDVETQSEVEYHVPNVYSAGCVDTEEINDSIEERKVVELIESIIAPQDKIVKLRDDHGKDKLKIVAEKLNKSLYINGVINSLPFNPDLKRFIKKVYPNGIIEIVLFWEDNGIGMAVQSTGRNLRETEMIANELNRNLESFK